MTITASVDEKITTSTEVNNQILSLLKMIENKDDSLSLEAGGEYEDTSG